MKQSGKKSFSSLRRGQFFRLLRGTSMNDVRRFLAIFDLPKPTNFWEFVLFSSFLLFTKFVGSFYGAQICLGINHKGRLLKGVGRGVHQKEIY